MINHSIEAKQSSSPKDATQSVVLKDEEEEMKLGDAEISIISAKSEHSQINDLSLQRRGRKSTYAGAKYPDLVDKAKLILPSMDYSLDKILEIDEFKVLKNSSDIPRFLSKFILNQATKRKLKSTKEVSVKLSPPGQKTMIEQKDLNNRYKDLDIKDQKTQIEVDSRSQQINLGAKIQSEITSSYLREFMAIPLGA